jgi:adenine-specific DNA-methyltransferase
MDSGFVRWPKLEGRKPNAIVKSQQTESLLLPLGHYVVVRRFSAKEERRRVVAAIFDPDRLPEVITCVGFENHLNVYHSDSTGLPPELAKGLASYLNSTLVDTYFRLFNGHTQVNANDLRVLRYPSLDKLTLLGTLVGDLFPKETEIDNWLERELHYV